MFFKLTYSLNRMNATRETDLPSCVRFDEKNKFVLWMREVEHEGKPVRQLCCDFIVERDPPERVVAALRALKDGRLLLDEPPQMQLPYKSLSGEIIVDADGSVQPKRRLALSQLPSGA